MKKIICLLLSILLIICFVGCSDMDKIIPEDSNDSKDILVPSMFIVIEEGLQNGYYYSVVCHKDTKVMYALSQDNYFTVMVDDDGKPLLYKGSVK